MDKLSFRQIHLDFHTSECIENIGRDFDKKEWQETLKLGHVSSINIFAKCHHGWAYNKGSKANEEHPYLEKDLLKEMIDACHEIGVKCPVYISAGLDEKIAKREKSWLYKNFNGKTNWVDGFEKPGYHEMCMNSQYLNYLKEQVVEIVKMPNIDGIWLDIVGEKCCCCSRCRTLAKEQGFDPKSEESMRKFGRLTYKKYYTTINDAIKKIKPDMLIFHNGGHIKRGRPDLERANTHLELESLPTGGWGYDNFPLSARYLQNCGMEYLGMTGKFHTTWGEFGGFKHPNALRYESSLCLAVGAKCCVGDQLHPLGKLDKTTYKIIGDAYSEVEKREKYCNDTHNIAEVAFITIEAADEAGEIKDTDKSISDNADLGALRILQEGQFMFDIIDSKHDFSKYKVVVLPDVIRITDTLKASLTKYIASGGKVLLTGNSGLDMTDKFCTRFRH